MNLISLRGASPGDETRPFTHHCVRITFCVDGKPTGCRCHAAPHLQMADIKDFELKKILHQQMYEFCQRDQHE